MMNKTIFNNQLINNQQNAVKKYTQSRRTAMDIKIYSKEDKKIWNEFAGHAKNGHFFFQRDYMEYHNDRFNDFSLLIFNHKNQLIALLPANLKDNTLYSHQGLTFGGFITDERMKTEIMLNIFESLRVFCLHEQIHTILYKCIPYIYHIKPAEEDRYALFRQGAKLVRRDVTATINLNEKINFQKQRIRAIRKAEKNGLRFERSSDLADYWKILEKTIAVRHNAKPIHSVAEIMNLVNLFPDNIKLYIARKEGALLAGALVYENSQTVHTLYLANSIEGRKTGALDLVISTLIQEIYKDKRYFDLGRSNQDDGRYLNTGLIAQKEGFGARAVVHDTYELAF